MKSLRLLIRWVLLPIATIGVAFAITATLFEFTQSIVGVFFLTAVMVTAYIGRFAAGVIAAVLSMLCVAYFMPPAYSLAVGRSEAVGLVAYGTLAVVTAWFTSSRRSWGEELTAARARVEELLSREKKVSEEVRFLSDASVLLASSLDYETTLKNLARMAVPGLADWAAVHLIEGGQLRRVAVAHADPAKVALADELEQRYPMDPNAAHGVPNVMRTGKPEMVSELSDAVVRAAARDPEHLRLMRSLGLRSYMVVPLQAHDRILGAITFVAAESDRRYDESDLRFAEDLARRAAVAVENARLFREVQDANRAKDEFLAMLSHELRNPITSIVGWVHVLQGGAADPGTLRTAVESIGASATLQSRLIDDMLDVSRIILGKLRLDMGRVDIASVIREGVKAAQPIADEKQVELDVDVNCAPCPVTGDAARLQQVVWNLASNAVKFTPPGGRVKVTLARTGFTARITVEDNGEGITQEFLPHLFERFTQDEVGRRRGGLGLGLAITQALVEMHGGTIRAESDGPGKGSRFIVDLPLLRGGEERSSVAATA